MTKNSMPLLLQRFSKILLPPRLVEMMIFYLAALRAKTLPGKDAATFLMSLDQRLYPLHGRAAVAYGHGIHTKHRHTRYHDFFIRHIGQGDRVLDVGCGMGALAFDVAEQSNARVVGIDLNRRSIQQAMSQFAHPRVEYHCGDALRDLPEEAFDVVILSNVLEHIEHRPEFLRQLCTTVKPRSLLIRVPLYERDWRVPLKEELGIDYRLDRTHYTEYSQESFVAEMKAAGLHPTYMEIRWGEVWSRLEPADFPVDDTE